MTQFEPSRILENQQYGMENDSVQQYVEIGSNTFVGTEDGIQYALMQTSDNKYRLCEIPSVASVDANSGKNAWADSFSDETRNDSELAATPSSGCKTIKLVTLKSESTPCKGQGDESGNAIFSTPESLPRFKVLDNVQVRVPDDVEDNQNQLSESSQLTYTTLVTKKDSSNSMNAVDYGTPRTYFQSQAPMVPVTQTPVPMKSVRIIKTRPRMQLIAGRDGYSASPVPATMVGRHRRQRQTWFQYNPQILHSTPTNAPASSQSSNISTVSIESNGSFSNSSCNESQASLEYPRVPNNTPTSGEGDINGKQKIMELDWIPQVATRIESYIPMDPRESHNEKERKRRLRIKNACQYMRGLLPCVSDKTDNATVFEHAAHFIAFMKENVGTEYDIEFLEQSCVY